MFDQNGRVLIELTSTGIPSRWDLYAGGLQIASYQWGNTYFIVSDWLGTARNWMDWAGNSYETCTNLPFGEGPNCSNTDLSPMHFTGQEHDSESNLEHTWFRQYSSTQGRWMSPDPAGLAAADPSNPQSWNQYAYVRNNPVNAVDPLGLFMYVSVPDYNSLFWYLAGSPISREYIIEPGGGNGSGGGDPGPPVLKRQAPTQTPANDGQRNCTPSPTSGVGQSLRRTATAALLTTQFFSGFGPSDVSFGPDSAASQGMALSDGVQTALNDYAVTGRTSGLYTFDAPNVARTGLNSMGQFVGSFTWTITPANGGINLSLSNYTSVWSGSYHKLPNHSRASFAPLGTTHQTYNIFVSCGG